MRKKIKLVLSGSGTRYPCFVGAINRLLLENVEIEAVCGTSGGAIVAAGLASCYDKNNHVATTADMTKKLYNTMPGPLLDRNMFPFFRKGIYAGNKILKALRDNLEKDFSQTKIPVSIITFNNNTSRHKIWTERDTQELPLTVRASMSLPVIFDLVKIDGDWHSDGGIVSNFKLDVFGKNAKNVLGITFSDTLGGQRKEILWKKDLIQSHLDGAVQESMLDDIYHAHGAEICFIDTEHGGLNLEMTTQDVAEQVKDGYYSMDRYLKDNKNKLLE